MTFIGTALAGYYSVHFESERAIHSQAVLAQKREAFLGYVLLARGQMEWMTHQAPTCLPEAVLEHPTSVARQAYAVALLYLADMRPLAGVFYETTGRLQQALLGADDAAAVKCQAAWIQSFKEIEEALVRSGRRM